MTTEHLVQHNPRGPEIGRFVDGAGVEPFRGCVGHAAEKAVGELARERQPLGNSEVEHSHAVRGIDPDVLRFDVTMDDGAQLPAINL
jgi:hypothetical protein